MYDMTGEAENGRNQRNQRNTVIRLPYLYSFFFFFSKKKTKEKKEGKIEYSIISIDASSRYSNIDIQDSILDSNPTTRVMDLL